MTAFEEALEILLVKVTTHKGHYLVEMGVA